MAVLAMLVSPSHSALKPKEGFFTVCSVKRVLVVSLTRLLILAELGKRGALEMAHGTLGAVMVLVYLRGGEHCKYRNKSEINEFWQESSEGICGSGGSCQGSF